MILNTTRERLNHIRKVADDLLLGELEFVVGDGVHSRSKVSGDICYSAGIALRDAMVEVCFTSRETMRRGLSSSVHGAHRDLVRATNEEARHPALRGVGMEGHEFRVFPAWRVAPDLYSPFPIEGGEWALLAPVPHLNPAAASEKFTLWEVGGMCPADYRLADEALHWSFLQSQFKEVTT